MHADNFASREKTFYLKIRNFEVECHVGNTNQNDGLEEDSPEVIGPLPLKDGQDPDDVCFLRVVGHGVHDCVSYDVLHQLAAAEVLRTVAVCTLGWDLDQHLNVLLGHAVDLNKLL